MIVLKFGSSVLCNEGDLGRAIGEIDRWVRRGARVVAVVSAFKGRTDRLLEAATSLDRDDGVVHEHAVAMLVGIGEMESASMLTLALHRAGHRVSLQDAAALGLCTQGPALEAMPEAMRSERLMDAFEHAEVVVVPGFVGRDEHGRPTLLGRGGSDLTALFVAEQTGARCRLVKDVAGVFEGDPACASADAEAPRVYSTLAWRDACELGGRVIQGRAASFAMDRGVEYEVGCVGRDEATRIGRYESRTRPARGQSREVADLAMTVGRDCVTAT